jgi:hypothetical protein
MFEGGGAARHCSRRVAVSGFALTLSRPNRPGASRGCAYQDACSLMSVMEVLAAASWRNATACPKVSPVVWPAS